MASPPGTAALQFGVARLKRPDEVYSDHPVYFLTACTFARRGLLDRASVLRAVVDYGQCGPEVGAWLGSFVLMPDHWHAFVALDAERCRLSAWVSGLKAAVGRVLKSEGIEGPYWQKGFFDHVLRGSESASEKWGICGTIRCGRGWCSGRRIGLIGAKCICCGRMRFEMERHWNVAAASPPPVVCR